MLEGLRVVELASDRAAYAGKLLADLGPTSSSSSHPVATPPGRSGPSSTTRRTPIAASGGGTTTRPSDRSSSTSLPRAGSRPSRVSCAGPTSCSRGSRPGSLRALGLDHPDFRRDQPGLIWVSVTPFGRRARGPRRRRSRTSRFSPAAGSCGTAGTTTTRLPPVRGGGGQAQHIAGALRRHRDAHRRGAPRMHTGRGQHVDVSMHAAVNVTTESGTFVWLVAERDGPAPDRPPRRDRADDGDPGAGRGRPLCHHRLPSARGRGLPGHPGLAASSGHRGEFPEAFFLQMGVDRGGVDPRAVRRRPRGDGDLRGRSRGAVLHRVPASRPTTSSSAPRSATSSAGSSIRPRRRSRIPHFRARGFPVAVHHPELGRDIVYPGAPFHGSGGGWRISRRPPLVGEHDPSNLFDVRARACALPSGRRHPPRGGRGTRCEAIGDDREGT